MKWSRYPRSVSFWKRWRDAWWWWKSWVIKDLAVDEKKKIGWHVMSSELYSYEHWLCRMVDWSRYETWRHMKKLSGGKPSMDVFSLTWLNLAEWIWTKNNMKMQNQLKKRRCWSWAARTTLNYGKINCLAPNEEEKIGISYENRETCDVKRWEG